LAFDREIGGQHHLGDAPFDHVALEPADRQLFGADAVQGRQVSHEHEIDAPERTGLLDGLEVRRRLHHAQELLVAPLVGADPADLRLAEVVAVPAVGYFRQGSHQRLGDLGGALAVAFEQVKGDALGALRTHAGQALESVEQVLDGRTRRHAQRGRFRPGMLRPPATPLIFSWTAFSAFCTASLNAAATRSSSTSLSSPIRAGSMVTERTSCRQVMTTVTMPPPD